MSDDGLFRSEYRAELDEWLQRRFRFLCIVYVGVTVLDALGTVLVPFGAPARTIVIQVVGSVAGLGMIAWFGFAADLRNAGRERTLRAATRMILGLGTVSLLSLLAAGIADPGTTSRLIVPLFFWHFSACLFLPWSPRESVRPFVPLMLVWAAIMLFTAGGSFLERAVQVIVGPGVLVPGLAIAAWRLQQHQRSFRRRMVGRHFLSMRREFSRARSIHESIFPAPMDDGRVRLEYVYTPARELGGDFLHFRVSPEGVAHLVVLDVTGHGLPAALTVNRLYGELERIRAEQPDAGPGTVITLLNRYVFLTMAHHNIFATGLALQLDPDAGTIAWSNAGHPPALVRGLAGSVRALDSTAPMLGALDADEFIDEEKSMAVDPGTTVLLYTDGAFEGRDRTGRQLGLERLRDLVRMQPAPRNWPLFLSSAVARHHGGRTDDDVLICALTALAPAAADRRIVPEPEQAATR